MHIITRKKEISTLMLMVLICVAFFAGCGGGGNGTTVATTPAAPTYPVPVYVGSNGGPVAYVLVSSGVATATTDIAGNATLTLLATGTATIRVESTVSTVPQIVTMTQDVLVATNTPRVDFIAPAATCGNGTSNPGEQCDNGMANTNTACVAGYGASCSYCDLSCQSHTVVGSSCGDSIPDVSNGEQCDYGNLNTDNACVPGVLTPCSYCTTACQFITVNPPAATCGNGSLDSGEQCDNGIAGNTNTACAAPYGGSCSYCDTSCNSHTVTGDSCGDGAVNGAEGCDQGSNNTNAVCTAPYGGSCSYCDMTCNPHTVTGSYCGDSTTNAGNGEQCDNGASNTNTACVPGYGASCTYCNTACQSNTVVGPSCGDGAINGAEQCDGALLNGATCVSRGFDGGTLSCSACSFNTSACYSSQQYSGEWNATGNPRGVSYANATVYVADSSSDSIIISDEAGNPTAASPLVMAGMHVEQTCFSPDGTKMVVTGGTSSKFALYTISGGVYTEVGKFGSHGTGAEQFDIVEQCVFDSDGIIVSIVDDTQTVGNNTNHGFCQWDSVTHAFLGCTRGKGTTDGLFTRPYGIARDPSGNIYVGDRTGRIQKFSSTGVFIINLGTLATTPLSLAYLNEMLYVSDYVQNKVNVFDTNGGPNGFVNDGGAVAGNMINPIGLALKSDGTVFVSQPFVTPKKITKYAP